MVEGSCEVFRPTQKHEIPAAIAPFGRLQNRERLHRSQANRTGIGPPTSCCLMEESPIMPTL